MQRRRNEFIGFYPVGSHGEVTATGVTTITRPDGADGIILQNNGTANVTYRLDEGTPDADTGFLLSTGDSETRLDLWRNDVKVFLATNARVQYQWFRLL